MHRLAYLPAAIVSLAAGTAHAQPAAAIHAQPDERHQGVFVRLTPGIAGSAALADVDDTELTLQGGAGRLGIALGVAVSPRVILAAELLGHAVLGPELERDGATTVTDDDVVWGVSYAGLGLHYYLPSNLYLAASAGALMMTLETSDMEMSETELGFGMKLGIGKEWWVSSEVGLGLGLELLAGSVPDDETDWSVATLGLAFSATYN